MFHKSVHQRDFDVMLEFPIGCFDVYISLVGIRIFSRFSLGETRRNLRFFVGISGRACRNRDNWSDSHQWNVNKCGSDVTMQQPIVISFRILLLKCAGRGGNPNSKP